MASHASVHERANTTTKTAASAVFEVPELLEMVLLQLPCLEIFVLQRVPRFWQASINAFRSLRSALFLKPAKCTINMLSPEHDPWNWLAHGSEELFQYDVIRPVPERNVTAARMLELLSETRDYTYLNPFVTKVLNKRLTDFAWKCDCSSPPDSYLIDKFPLVRANVAQPPGSGVRPPFGSRTGMSLTSPPLEKLEVGVWPAVLNDGEILSWLERPVLSAGEGPVTMREMASFVDHVLDLNYTAVYSPSDFKLSPLEYLADEMETLSFSFQRLHSDLIQTAQKVRPVVESRAWLEQAPLEVRRAWGL